MLGAKFRIRPIFWASSLLVGVIYYRDPDIGGMGMFWFWIAAALVTVLAHEISHVLLARLFGSRVRIVLLGLGGQAYGLEERSRWQRVVILLGGGLGNLLICGILWLIADPQRNPLPVDRLGAEGTSFIANAVKTAFVINALWAFLNVLPLWPLDGGRVAVDIGEGLLGRRGQIAALLVSLLVCLLLSFTVIMWGWLSLTNRFDPHYPLYLLYFCIQSLYCYFLWLSTFRALWGDTDPFEEGNKSGFAA
jgi:Zn-dependent protease